jgi:AraC-like DNA-binding protein
MSYLNSDIGLGFTKGDVASSTNLELRSYSSDSSRHSHDYAQLVLPVRGVLELEIGNKAGAVQSNHAAFIPKGETHCFSAKDNNLFLVVDLKTPLPNVEQSFPLLFYRLDSPSIKLINFIEDYCAKGAMDCSSQVLTYNLLLNTLTKSAQSVMDAAVLKAKNWLENNFSEPINISHLAKHCYLSNSQLQRRFYKVMGCSLAHYGRIRLLEHAKMLLSTTAQSIESIAGSVGYEHLSAFSRAFSHNYQQSPSQWREMMYKPKYDV